jgi:predicted dehydrogenase
MQGQGVFLLAFCRWSFLHLNRRSTFEIHLEEQAVPEMTKARIGVIGCGTVTTKFYVPSLRRMEGVHVEYVYDVNEENSKAVAAALGAKIEKPEFIFRNSDFTIIATPPGTHFQLIKQGLSAGAKNIVCEKPFLGNVGEAAEVIAQAEASGSNLFVAHFRRCFPSVNLAREMSLSDILGSLKSIHIAEGGRFAWETKSGYVTKDPFGGVLFDTGSHTIDMAIFAAGLDSSPLNVEVKSVTRDKPEPSHEIKASLSLASATGVVECKLHFSRYGDLSNRIKLVFERGTLEFSSSFENKIRLTANNRSVVICSEQNFHHMSDCFIYQYYQMFNSIDSQKFEGSRFVTLTSILEQVSSFTD